MASPALAAPVKAPARATLPPRLQAKLDVGPSGDHFEQEADRVSAAVMSGSAAPVTIPPTITPIGAQRKAAPPKREEEKPKPAPALAKAAQRKAMPAAKPKEEKKPAKAAQRKAMPGTRPKEEDKKPAAKAQRDAFAGAAGGTASPGVESAIDTMRAGPASGLDSGTRGFMESRFGRDFGDVRVHHGTEAAKAADAVGARAFTTGNDIFFNAGQYQPQTLSGRALLAHELTHTVQQKGSGGTAARKRIQRIPNPPAPGGPPAATKEAVPANGELAFKIRAGDQECDGQLKTATGQQEIVLPFLNLPTLNGALKGTAMSKSVNGTIPTSGVAYTIPPPGRATGLQPVDLWLRDTRARFSTGLEGKLNTMLRPPTANPTAPPDDAMRMPNGFYVLGFKDIADSTERETSFMWGTIADLARARPILVPRWSASGAGAAASFQADHILETQLGGADDIDNLWLLEASCNRDVGPAINGRVLTDINNALTAIRNRYDVTTLPLPAAAAIRTGWKITFLNQRNEPRMPKTTTFWTRQAIEDGDQLNKLKFLNSRDLAARGFQPQSGTGTPSRIYVFPTESGGKMTRIDVGEGGRLAVPSSGIWLFPNMYVMGGQLGTGNVMATLNVKWQKTRRTASGAASRVGGQIQKDDVPKSVDLARLPGFYDVSYVTSRAVQAGRDGWDLSGMSPVTFADLALNDQGYLVGSGSLLATKALFPGLRANLVMDPTEIRMDFPIPSESFSLGPVSVTSLVMSVGVGDQGIFLRGMAGFMIDSLGTGTVTAELSREGPMLAGEFNLDMDFLNPANVAVSYNFAADAFSAQATLGVQAGKIPGVESGQVTVGMTRDTVSVAGSLNLGGPLRGTIINVTYNQTDGLRIGADNIPLPLSSIPAVQNATLSLSGTRRPGGEGWSFGGTGQATLAVPGATGTIGITYLDGAVTFTANAQLARGPASGTLNFTATNRAIDEEGRPIEGPPTDTITVWGRGSVTIAFGRILTGTAGVELTPDNRVLISGRIALPPVFEVFPRREFNRDLFTLRPPEIPVWGVSVAGIGVGIFAFVDARVFFNAYVGPGEIRDAHIDANLDLDHPEDATVSGHAEFHVPAYAGLGLDVGGGLRARLAVAYAQGRVGLTGALGIQADAAAGVDISWSRDAGLALSASVSAQAQPKFELAANASVEVGVDVLVGRISHTFGPWTRQLGSFGPDMTLGVTMPVRWSEASGLDLSLDNIQVQRPSLDASALMMSVFDRLVA